jgi:glycosyltransferase involved in cell wall biosynthesis
VKVLFIYKYLTVGGVETVLRARFDYLKKWEVDAYAWFLVDGPGRSLFKGFEKQIGIGGIHAFADHIDHNQYDLLDSLDTEEIFPLLQRRHPAPKLVVEFHTPYRENQAYLRSLGSLNVDAFFVPSAFQAEVARSNIKRDAVIKVIPNPLNPLFTKEPSQFLPIPPRPVMGWIGRMDDLKNWPEFFHIAGNLRRRGQDIEYWIIGAPAGIPVADRLLLLARKERILDRLQWFRGVPHKHMPAFLDAIRDSGGVVITTSRGDSFGMTIAEAMARCCAVVVPSEGPFREFVSAGEDGFYYHPGNPEDAANKIETLLADDKLREKFGHHGRNHILQQHNPDHAVGVLAKEFHSIVGC